jgi:tRNA A37 threonylcarbamoyltransferase TsaD
MAKKKMAEAEVGLTTVAVAVGSALGKLAQKIGLGETPAPAAQKPAKKKSVARKSPAPKKKAAVKKVAAKRASVKKAKSPAKKK